MKVLWICNSPIKKYWNSKGVSASGASWIEGIVEKLESRKEYELAICFPYKNVLSIMHERIDAIDFYIIPPSRNVNPDKGKYKKMYREVFDIVRPDIIHIWGSEFPWLLEAVDAAKEMGLIDCTILNLQGMCMAISSHYYAGLPRRVVNSYTFRDFLKRDNIRRQRKDFATRAKYECEALSKLKYVIGRTDYDYAYSTMFNKELKYFKCNETLRGIFYEKKWNYEDCIKYRILLSQGYYPVKGVHIVIEALDLIKDKYPDIEVIITGHDILRTSTTGGRLRECSYARYLRKMLKKKGLEKCVRFVGLQDEKEMCERYLESNIFISPSSTENESNSLGEAKLLGMPVIASFVGGVANRIENHKDGLAYQHDDSVILARLISDIFDNPKEAIQMGDNARVNELLVSNRERNFEELLNIYHEVFINNKID